MDEIMKKIFAYRNADASLHQRGSRELPPGCVYESLSKCAKYSNTVSFLDAIRLSGVDPSDLTLYQLSISLDEYVNLRKDHVLSAARRSSSIDPWAYISWLKLNKPFNTMPNVIHVNVYTQIH